jgi:multidrug efflux pump subunit AcrA (membrane-fusion protein)
MVDENTEIVEPDEEPESIVETDAPAETEKKGMSPRNKALVTLGLVLLTFFLVAAYLVWFRNSPAPETAGETDEEKVVSVKVAKAEKEPIAEEFSAVGTVEPSEQAAVSAGISAQIKQMRLLKNSLVHQGDVLAVLESSDLAAQRNEAQAALEEARLNLQTLQKVTIPQSSAQTNKDVNDAKATADNARATYERRRVLYDKGGISLKELEASQLALTNADNAYRLALENSKINRNAVNPNAKAIAEAKIKQAQDHLQSLAVQAERGIVRAPITGIVTDQSQFEGEFAQQGAKLLTIANIGGVIVKAQFADTVVNDVKVGDLVTIYPAQAPDEKMTGRVSLISRASDPQNRTVEVWANFGNPQGLLTAGGAVQFVVSSTPIGDAIVVPESAVTLEAANADEGTVMVVDQDSVAHETKVKIGIKQGGKIQIVEGLNEGDTVVTEGNYELPDGTKVEVAKEEE